MAGDDDYEIPENGAVFTFGRSRFAENQSSHFFIRNDPVVEISCGDEHTALVCKNGRVFLFGHNDYGQLGLGHTKTITKPSCLKYLKAFHSNHVACGKGHTVVATECGKLFAFGSNSDGQLGLGDLNDRLVPQAIKIEPLVDDKIIAVAAGCLHSAYLTGKGEAYFWGSNSDGQCGVEVDENLMVPSRVQFDLPIRSISCGYYHSAFTSDGGSLYTFGEGDNGKLGLPGDTSAHNQPQKVDMECNCTMVQCGGNHTLVLSEEKTVYVFGSNFSGQLGIGNNDSQSSVPIRLKFPRDGVKVTYVSCGESHSAFITECGELYTCGDARHGKLCNEDDSVNSITPTLVTLFENYFCSLVSCGGCHTMVLARVRLDDNDPDIICSQIKLVTLPPLKIKKDVTDLENAINNEVEAQKENLKNGNGNGNECHKSDDEADDKKEEGFDSKSNTESNINNEENHFQNDEIYSEIREIGPAGSDDIIQQVESIESSPDNSPTLSVTEKTGELEKDVVTKENRIKKILNIFRRKKSVSAVLIKENSTENISPRTALTKEVEERVIGEKIGNQETSKTCIIL